MNLFAEDDYTDRLNEACERGEITIHPCHGCEDFDEYVSGHCISNGGCAEVQP